MTLFQLNDRNQFVYTVFINVISMIKQCEIPLN